MKAAFAVSATAGLPGSGHASCTDTGTLGLGPAWCGSST